MNDVQLSDYHTFLSDRSGRGPIVASIPTAVEVALDVDEWANQFIPDTLDAILYYAGAHPVVLVQTDRLFNGRTHSWPHMIGAAADRHTRTITWHKIALRRPPDTIDIHRPTYRHVVAVGGRPGARTPDVWYDGPPLWEHGTGLHTANRIAEWLVNTRAVPADGYVLNPFCGAGTIVRACHDAGLRAVGCDNNPERVTVARHLIECTPHPRAQL